MTTPTWHIERAKAVLEEWFHRAAMWDDIAEEHPWAKSACKGNSLMCKTLGLVWHDRHKMLLDARRKY